MHVSELGLTLLWLLAPPLLVGITLLGLYLSRRAPPRFGRFASAVGVLVTLGLSIAWLFAALTDVALDGTLGTRTLTVSGVTIPWAPFAFIAVALAFPVAAWWAGGQRARPDA